MAEHKQETPRPPDSPNQPPPRVWLIGQVAFRHSRNGGIPYIPRTELDAVWEKAIAIVNGAWRTRWYNGATSDAEVSLVKEVIKALEAARESEKQG